MEKKCEGCKRLWHFLVDAQSGGDVKRDEFSDEYCSHHNSLIRQFWNEDNKGRWHRIFKMDSYDPCLRDSNSTGWDLRLVNKASVPNHPGRYRILEEWVDIDLLQQWKDMCLTGHGERCDNPMKIWPVRPAWLIDVERKCLVSGRETNNDRFVALSYIYGASPSFKITEVATLSRLQIPNSLASSEMLSSISPIIQHAMYLTTVLGERFLWADALCIPHYDKTTTAEQLNSMGAIYATALITIIVTDTDSEQGILGLRGVSRCREMAHRIVPFGTEQIVARLEEVRGHPLAVENSPYNLRGWTYQEGAMSCRRLIFTQDELVWDCSCSHITEGMLVTSEARPLLYPSYQMDTILAGFPDIESLTEIFADFNRRDLSYDEDALPSISGLLSIFSRTFSNGFLYGLPERFFDNALGWTMMDRGVRRRKASSRLSIPDRTDLGPSGLPSWSWIGWQGLLDTKVDDYVRIHEDVVPPQVRETFPITTWFTAKSSAADASERRRIDSSWYADRETYKDLNKPLPAGWTRHIAHGGDADPESGNSFIFKYEDEALGGIPMDETRWWYYPVTVADISTSSRPCCCPEQTEYLFCESYRAQLWAYRRHHPDDSDSSNELDNCTADLFSAEGGRMGFLESLGGLDDFPYMVGDGKSGSEVPIGKQVELVAISRVREYERPWLEDECDFEEEQWNAPYMAPEEKMAVLWVEWVNGVAHRLGYGEVKKEEWVKLPLERIELVLG
ncbi:heterokaryon incompatibility protein-domain-containing protein [Nemania abortiva]|nr:heterokaryon incompatibility protein-domain-containing protein [Nemania abortiva]